MRLNAPAFTIGLLLTGALFCPVLRGQDPPDAPQATPQDAQAPQPTPSKRDQQRSFVKPDPKRAKKLAEQAAREEAAGDSIAALNDYEEAAHYAPFDVNIVSKGAAIRSRLLRQYTDDAERLAILGDLNGATLQLAAALEVDPGNTTVLERLQQMSLMQNTARRQEEREPPPAGLARLAPEKTRRSFNIQTDVKTAYEQVASAFGLKVMFDPDLPGRATRLRLQDVDFETAVKVLGLVSGTFFRPIDAKLFFVAADTAEKRRDYEPEIEQTLYLPASVNSTDIGEMVRAVRDLTGLTRVTQSNANHAIVVRGPVQRVQLASQIIRNLDQAPGEVLLEIQLLEVDRSNARNLGITPPASLTLYSIPPNLANSLRSAPDLTSLLTLLAQVFGGAAGLASGGIASLASSIPPIAAIGGGKSTFLLGLPTFSAQFSEGLSLVHSGREILLRAQDSKPATFFVGDRFPITLSLLSGSLGSSGFSANPGGTGVTIPTEQFTVGNNPTAMVTADFRSAGTLDLAVLNQGDNTLTILLNQGVGAANQFAQPTSGIGLLSPISLGTKWTTSTPNPAIATGSFNTLSTAPNNDNFADLLITDPVGNAVIVLLGNGDGTFKTPATPIEVGNQPSAIVTGEFDLNKGDSNFGFVVTNFKDNTYSVFNGNGDGTFKQVTGSPFKLPSTAAGPVAITSGDFNGDGFTDLAILNQTTANVTILKGNGDGTFTEFTKSPLAVGNLPVAMASGSLNGSTGPALAIVNQQDNSITVYFGNGDGTFFTASQSPLSTSTTPTGVAIADFTQEGNGGIAVANTGADTVTIFADLGGGLFTSALEPPAGTSPFALVAGAFTNSTFPDVAVTNNISGSDGQVTLIVSPVSLISNGGTSQQPYPGSEYEDIGIKIKATPQLHDTKDVTLQLEFDIKALSGTSVNGIPVISNRTVTQTVRLKENETSLVTGLLSRDETKTITGIPGLAGLPGVGYAFGNRNTTYDDDELLFLITPRRMRSPLHEPRTIYAGMGDAGGRTGAARGGPLSPRERQGAIVPSPDQNTPVEPQPEQPAPAPVPTNPPAGLPPTPPPSQQPNDNDVPLQRPPE